MYIWRQAMTTVSIKEARRRLSALVTSASRGERIVIARRGRNVAQLGPIVPARRRGLADLSRFRASLKVRGRSLTEELLALRREERA